MDAIKFIRNEHSQIRKKFSTIKKSLKTGKYPTASFNKLTQFLVRHETMEQKVWYPKLKRNPILGKVIKKLLGEEKSAAKAIKKIKKAVKQENQWKKEVLSLAIAVNHHANDEEKKLFPKVRKLVDAKERLQIGSQLAKFKLRRKIGRTP